MSDRRELRQRITAVARAMREAWNPIGVDDLPADEYDSYAPVVAGMFERGESDLAVAEHLVRLESQSMGLPSRVPAELVPIVQVLRAAT